jgi:hypothetical protein
MTLQYSVTLRNNRLDEIVALAGSSAWLQVWTGSIPATPVSAPGGTLLASCSMSDPIAPAASSGVLTMSAIADDSDANAGGTPTFARIATSETGTTSGVVQMTAGVGSGDLNFDAAVVVSGTVSINSLALTDGTS